MREVNETNLEEALEKQIPEVVETAEPEKKDNGASQYLGTKLTHKIGEFPGVDKEADSKIATEKHLTRVGEKIGASTEVREGWMDVDKRILEDKAIFYPESWQFKIRPATVEAIRNWSAIDDENALSIDEVFNEVLKSCLSINNNGNPIPWGNVRSWDRFLFVLLVREYSESVGEKAIEYTEECPNCGNDVTFKLTSTSLMYEMPDPEVMKYFSQEDQTWVIDPNEYGVDWPEPIVLYLPTLEKDANIRQWLVDRVQNKKNYDKIFMKFLPWLAPKISKDLNIAKNQIREYEVKYKSWDKEMFSFMNEVITNITVVPNINLKTTCPICGEEVTSPIRFQDGIRALFDTSSGRKKFGKK